MTKTRDTEVAESTVTVIGTGAMQAASPAAAMVASPLTLITLKDYGAVQDVLDQVGAELSGRTVVVLCTGSPADAQRARARVESAGGDYIDGGVQTSPKDIGTDVATILYSGSPSGFRRHLKTLRLLSTPRYVGTSAEAAAVWDLTLFGVWYDAQLGLLRALEAVEAAGIDIDEFIATAAIQLGHVIEGSTATAAELRKGEYPPGPASLDEHLAVLRQLINLRTSSKLGDGGLAQVSRVVESRIADGRRQQGLTATLANNAR